MDYGVDSINIAYFRFHNKSFATTNGHNQQLHPSEHICFLKTFRKSMAFINNISIRHKIIFLILIIYIPIASIGLAIFSINENLNQRRIIKQNAQLMAKYTAEYCSAPLFFGNSEETSEILNLLDEYPNLVFAAIYDMDGHLFDYINPSSDSIPDLLWEYHSIDSIAIVQNSSTVDKSESVIAKVPITYNRNKFGTFILKLSLQQAKFSSNKNIRMACIIASLLLLLTYILATIVQKNITRPITALTKVAEEIRKKANFSIRLEHKSQDEIGLLYTRFNNMLEEIELREKKRDKTEKMLQEAKSEAENADRLKSSFLANMSHEIRTPMNSIIGFAGLLSEPGLTQAERNEYVELINSSCDTLLHLIDDILDISKIEAGQIRVAKSTININSIINELYTIFYKINANSNNGKVEFILNIPEGYNLVVNSDEIRLKQILNNLLGNAIKFTHEGTIEFGYTIIERIRKNSRERQIKFFVKDTGIGISPKIIDSIFKRFTKIEPDNNKLYSGAGLGLTISKKLAEILGGQIWAESELKKGSTFYLTIPLTNEEEKIESKPENKQDQILIELRKCLKGKEILICEDDPANFELLKALLKKTNVTIMWAKTGAEGVAYCNANNPYLILMDIKMPDMDGYEAVDIIRSSGYKSPIIAQTAYARFEDEKSILQKGFNAHISKPIHKESLYGSILKVLNNFD